MKRANAPAVDVVRDGGPARGAATPPRSARAAAAASEEIARRRARTPPSPCSMPSNPATTSRRAVATTEPQTEVERAAVAEAAGRRKGRTSMPSWDEIVFGARTED